LSRTATTRDSTGAAHRGPSAHMGGTKVRIMEVEKRPEAIWERQRMTATASGRRPQQSTSAGLKRFGRRYVALRFQEGASCMPVIGQKWAGGQKKKNAATFYFSDPHPSAAIPPTAAPSASAAETAEDTSRSFARRGGQTHLRRGIKRQDGQVSWCLCRKQLGPVAGKTWFSSRCSTRVVVEPELDPAR